MREAVDGSATRKRPGAASTRTSTAPKNGGVFPKTSAPAPLPGSLHAEYKRCGRATCRCAHPGGGLQGLQGQQRRQGLHGPYWVRRWREAGRLRRQYVPAAQVAVTREAIAAYRRLHPPAWHLRQHLAGLRRLLKEATEVKEEST